MFDQYIQYLQKESVDAFSSSDIILIASLIISLIAIYISIKVAYINKKLDFRQKQFEDLCLKPVQSILKEMDEIFTLHENDEICKHIAKIPTIMSDFQLYIGELSKFYKKINVNVIIKSSESFSDKLFNNPQESIAANKSCYYEFKLTITSKLYEYAIKKEIQLIPQLNRPK